MSHELDVLEGWEKPHMRLFLSADIVGSTAYKQANSSGEVGGAPTWFNTVLAFYRQASSSLNNNWKALKDTCQKADADSWFGDAPELWKTVGDEVLFTKLITHPSQIVLCIQAWIQTIDTLRSELIREVGLDVKSCAWLADFPLKNQQVILGKDAEKDDDHVYNNQLALKAYHDATVQAKQEYLVDYIGPSIDTGFRLGALASPRKLIISIELAYILSCEQAAYDEDKTLYAIGVLGVSKLDFKYGGRVPLKGVLGGSPYPEIWVDLAPQDEFNRAEDDVMVTPQPNATAIKRLAKAFIDQHSKYVSLPYFYGALKIPKLYGEIPKSDVDALLLRHESYLTSAAKHQAELDAQAVEIEPEKPDEAAMVTKFIITFPPKIDET